MRPTCLFRLSELNCVSMKMRRIPEFRQLLIGMSMRRYFPAMGTAGFDHQMSPWATVVADVISQWQVGENKLTLPGPVTITVPFLRTVGAQVAGSFVKIVAPAAVGVDIGCGMAALKTKKFHRIRIGTGVRALDKARQQSDKKRDEFVRDFVLHGFTPAQEEELKGVFKECLVRLEQSLR